jgi:hypothetical protein
MFAVDLWYMLYSKLLSVSFSEVSKKFILFLSFL